MSSLLDLKFTQYVFDTNTEKERFIDALLSSRHASTIGKVRKYALYLYFDEKNQKFGRAICFELCKKTNENTPRKVSSLSIEFNDGKPVSYCFSFSGNYDLVVLRDSPPKSDENLNSWTEFSFTPTWETSEIDKDAYDNLEVEWEKSPNIAKHVRKLVSNTAKYGLTGFYSWIKRYSD
jgi:hypothetical protein